MTTEPLTVWLTHALLHTSRVMVVLTVFWYLVIRRIVNGRSR